MATTLNPSEISELIKTRIEQVKLSAESRNEGTVTSVSDGIVRIFGLADAMQGEMIELPNKTYALALNLERDSVGAVILGDYKHLREGDVAKTTGRILEVPVGKSLLGRVVNALGEPIDGKGALGPTQTAPVERVAPGVIWRKSVDQPVQTGYKSVDAMIPIGRGQRETHHRRPPNWENRNGNRYSDQPERHRYQMRLCSDRPKSFYYRQYRSKTRRE